MLESLSSCTVVWWELQHWAKAVSAQGELWNAPKVFTLSKSCGHFLGEGTSQSPGLCLALKMPPAHGLGTITLLCPLGCAGKGDESKAPGNEPGSLHTQPHLMDGRGHQQSTALV